MANKNSIKSKAKGKSQPNKNETRHFKFRKHANVGAADAIDDHKFLVQSFVDNGEIEILTSRDDPQCIVLGRTGAGKTALLEKLEEKNEHIIKIAPEGLALTHIANSDVIKFFTTAGVDLDLFYRLLWRHVFAVELIRDHYNIVNEQARDTFTDRILQIFRKNKAKEEAIKYLLQWGDSFWEESEYRVTEVTSKLEKELGQSIGSELSATFCDVGGKFTLNSEAAEKLSEERKAEVKQRGQTVVNKVQMKVLSDIMNILENDILNNQQKRYFITIDRLDEKWVDESIRYNLIKALLDTVKDFNNKVRSVRVIVAIREDLLHRVFTHTREYGYQEEKYQSMYLAINWKAEDLEHMLDLRVNQLVQEQYHAAKVSVRDLLPNGISNIDSVEYLMSRTMMRPRDAIMFFNECIKLAEGQPKITQNMVFQAEKTYSESRLNALVEEWAADYPNLAALMFFFKKFPCQFRMPDVKASLEQKMMEFATSEAKDDIIWRLAKEKFESADTDGFIREVIAIGFQVGFLGIKQQSFQPVSWSFLGNRILRTEFDEHVSFHIHPAFYRVLGIEIKN